MVNSSDSLRYADVLSKPCRFHYSKMEQQMEQFITDAVECGGIVKGPMFYSLMNLPLDGYLTVEFFLPLYNLPDTIPTGMYYHSYFSIEDAISCYVAGDFIKNTEWGYAALLEYAETNGLKQNTPFFHIFQGDETFPFVRILFGTAQAENKNNLARTDT